MGLEGQGDSRGVCGLEDGDTAIKSLAKLEVIHLGK